MKFDHVVMNPSYNDDIYIDFVEFGMKVTDRDLVAITPAKWQAKSGKKNEEFRKSIVPYMKNITYYPDACDVFDIYCQGGVSIFKVEKECVNNVTIINKCRKNLALNNRIIRTLGDNITLLNTATSIIDKVKYTTLNIGNTKGEYGVYILSAFMHGGKMLNTGNTLLLGESHVESTRYYSKKKHEKILLQSNNKEFCESFNSYLQTKFVRFLLWISLCQQNISNTLWRFVPDPGNFDHIFTDQELYEKYNITQDEINIIESVIKGRKCA